MVFYKCKVQKIVNCFNTSWQMLGVYTKTKLQEHQKILTWQYGHQPGSGGKG
jgi:hypothetical protein